MKSKLKDQGCVNMLLGQGYHVRHEDKCAVYMEFPLRVRACWYIYTPGLEKTPFCLVREFIMLSSTKGFPSWQYVHPEGGQSLVVTVFDSFVLVCTSSIRIWKILTAFLLPVKMVRTWMEYSVNSNVSCSGLGFCLILFRDRVCKKNL
jgi:hypothetical protein